MWGLLARARARFPVGARFEGTAVFTHTRAQSAQKHIYPHRENKEGPSRQVSGA